MGDGGGGGLDGTWRADSFKGCRGGLTEGGGFVSGKASSIPLVDRRRSIWGVLLIRSAPALEIDLVGVPADVCGRLMRGGLGEFDGIGEGESGFIFPIDIFFRKPQRLFFSLVDRDRDEPSPSSSLTGIWIGGLGEGAYNERVGLSSTTVEPCELSHIDWLN